MTVSLRHWGLRRSGKGIPVVDKSQHSAPSCAPRDAWVPITADGLPAHMHTRLTALMFQLLHTRPLPVQGGLCRKGIL